MRRIISILCILLFAGFAYPAVTYDASASTSGANIPSLSWSHTTANQPNRAILVGITYSRAALRLGIECMVCDSAVWVDSVTIDGSPMTFLYSDGMTEIWFKYGQATGTNAMSVVFSGDVDWDVCGVDAIAGSTSFYGVHQTAGLSVVTSNSSTSNKITTYKTGTSANNMLWDNVCATPGAPTITPATGQTENWNAVVGNTCGLQPRAGSSRKTSLVGATSLNWTISASKLWFSSLVEVKEAAAAGTPNTAPNSSLVNLTNGTAGTALGTPFKNNPTYFNASGNCSDLENNTLTGVFNFYLNNTFWRNFTTYNWLANQTNYTNTSVTGLNKSDSLKVGLVCYDGGLWSNQTNSTAITVNNTMPTITIPTINSTNPMFTETLLCVNSSYSDVDSDVIGTGRWRWFLNNTAISGQTSQSISLPAISAHYTDRINCSYKTEDSGYDVKNSTEMFSTSVTVNQLPPNSSFVYITNGTAGTALGIPFKNNPVNYNASGNCSDLENSILTGVFNFYLNNTFWQNFTTYNWNANKTNYTNTSISGLNKSDSLFVGLICYDGSLWGNQTNSTSITVNNTAPITTAPSINNTYPYLYDAIQCNQGSYYDLDGDAQNQSSNKWYINGVLVSTSNTLILNSNSIGDQIICEWSANDSGYDMKSSIPLNSSPVIIISRPIYLPMSYTLPVYLINTNISLQILSTNVYNYLGVNITCLKPSGTIVVHSALNMGNIFSSLFAIDQYGTWLCVGQLYNDTYYEVNSSSFFAVCPSSLQTNISYYCYNTFVTYAEPLNRYYDILDYIIIWATPPSNTNEVFLYSTDNSTYNFTYSVSTGKWFTYYRIKQKQEVLQSQAFYNGILIGVSEVVLTINPNPPSQSIFDTIFRNSGYAVLVIAVLLIGIVAIIFALQLARNRIFGG